MSGFAASDDNLVSEEAERFRLHLPIAIGPGMAVALEQDVVLRPDLPLRADADFGAPRHVERFRRHSAKVLAMTSPETTRLSAT